jgi:hypothetical protein
MNSYHHTPIDETRVKRFLVVAFFFLLAVASAFWTLKSGNKLFMAAVIAVPFVIMLMEKPMLTFVLAVVLDATMIPVPGATQATVGILAKLILIGTTLLGLFMGHRTRGAERFDEKKPLLLLTAVTILIMLIRGAGLKILGSASWGGMLYIVQFIGIAFYLSVNGLRLSEKQVRLIIWGGVIAGIVGMLFNRLGWVNIAAEGSEQQAARLTWLTPIAVAVLPIALAVGKGRYSVLSILLVLFCLILVGLSGFRSRLVSFVFVIMGYGFFRSRSKAQYFWISMALMLVAWVFVVMVSSHLPLGLQRAVSFVPGAHIDRATAQGAQSSIEWRIEIWAYCLSHAKEYLLIGRGSALDVIDAISNLGTQDIGEFSPWFAYITHSYHSGPLSLLIDYGAAGLILGLWLAILIVKRFVRVAVKLAQIDSFEARFVLASVVYLIWKWVAFFAVYGDIPQLASYISSTAILSVISHSILGRYRMDKHQIDLESASGVPD